MVLYAHLRNRTTWGGPASKSTAHVATRGVGDPECGSRFFESGSGLRRIGERVIS